MIALRLARRELRGGLRGFRIFMACLALGVGAIAGVGSFDASITRALKEDARALLGGDIELSFTHRTATAEQLEFLKRNATISTVAEMRAMGRSASARTLVELKAVDDAYPLTGKVQLPGADDLTRSLEKRDGVYGAALESATLNRLSLKLGDEIGIGDARFAIRAIVEREPDRSANVFTLGPRVMIALAALPETGLIQPGSLVRYLYRLKLNSGVVESAFLAALKDRFPDAGWRIRGLNEAAPGVQRWIDRIAMFLTLVGLSALLVGGVGVANAVRGYLDGKTQTIATLKCLGAPARLILQVYLIQIMTLALIGVAIGLVIGALVPVVLAPLVADKLPVAAHIGIYPAPLLIAACFGVLTALAFSLWPIARSRDVPPAALFRDLVVPTRRWPRLSALIAIALALIALAALTIATAPDRRLAAWFVVGAGVVFTLFHTAAAAIAWLAKRCSHLRWPSLRLALANLHRPGSPTSSIMLSLGLGLTVMVAITQMQGNFLRTLREQLPEVAPSFFFIDIQPDQIAAFDALLKSMPGVEHVESVPSLRGRIMRIAGVPIEQAKIAPEAQWAIGSDRGLTYAAEPPPGTRLVAGEWWPADYRGPPLVSFDVNIAKGMGIGIGDTLTINILGREIDARIANLRAIDWTTLGINYTLIFAPGTLEAAPHTYVATARVADAQEDGVERAVTDQFVNVSTIRVKAALATVESSLDSIAAAARGTGAVTLLAGGLVLAGAIAATNRRRIYDAVVLKVLGATRANIVMAFALEFALLGGAASLAAFALGGIAADLLLTLYMRVTYHPLPALALATLTGAVVAVVAFGLAGTWRALGQKPAPVLRHA